MGLSLDGDTLWGCGGRVTTNTIFIHRKRLWYYGGSYDTFLKASL